MGPHTAVLTGMRYSIKCFVLIVSLMAPALVAADQFPDWTLESADGDAVTLSIEAQNQPVIVLFWATWCPYCKALMPYLDEIRAEYGDRVKILAVNFREKGDPVAYIRSKGYDFTILPKGDRVAMAYEIWGTPGVLLGRRDTQKYRFAVGGNYLITDNFSVNYVAGLFYQHCCRLETSGRVLSNARQ